MGIQARLCAFTSRSVPAAFILDNPLQNALAFLMSSSLPVAMATKRGHCSTLWSSLVKQAAQTFPFADDPETGGPEPGGPALLPSFRFFCGAVDADESSDDEDDVEEDDDDVLR